MRPSRSLNKSAWLCCRQVLTSQNWFLPSGKLWVKNVLNVNTLSKRQTQTPRPWKFANSSSLKKPRSSKTPEMTYGEQTTILRAAWSRLTSAQKTWSVASANLMTSWWGWDSASQKRSVNVRPWGARLNELLTFTASLRPKSTNRHQLWSPPRYRQRRQRTRYCLNSTTMP
jgi:hypothetical protein